MQPIDILLVEDNDGDILLTTEALQERKIVNNIFVLNDAFETLNYLLKKGPFINRITLDLILLNINLPKLNGQEVLRLIRSNKNISHIPVVMLSTSSSSPGISESIKNEANCYMTKPIDVDEFQSQISTIKGLDISSEPFLNS